MLDDQGAIHRHATVAVGTPRFSRLQLWRSRHVMRIAFRHAAFHPLADDLQVFLGEPAIIAELAKTLHRVPGRHAAFEYLLLDGLSPGPGFLICHQRERRSAGMMAGDAVLVDDPRYVLRPGDLGGIKGVRPKQSPGAE